MWLNRLKVSKRIYLGFGVLLLLGVSVAGFGVYQFSAVGQQVEQMISVATNMQRVLEATKLIGNYPGQIAWRDFGIATKLPFMRVSPLSGKAARIGDGLEGMTNTLAICAAL